MSPRKSEPRKTTKKPATKKAQKTAAGKKATRSKTAAGSVEKKAAPKARSSRRPTKREPVERVKVGGLRTLGDVEPGGRSGKPAAKKGASTARALEVLEQEFTRALALKEKLAAEAAIGGREKGREATRQQEKLRALINSLEGMNRFAMQMGLVTPAQARELYAKAMAQGLYEGWR